ncbi:hypothetical protein CMUS01_14219 [Colletotrichum musicola]|uniref:EF-hand domain-containing protein n=1 Tax=Colletotrichum musicola TaxID=2175873 RepID=A0A8H6J5S5_9PEZI|nr:hypothetical protein CMUS01_14219 [Colletotrichum musicola]
MKFATLSAVVLAALPVALACCCKPREQCKGMDLPICWYLPSGKKICAKDSRALAQNSTPLVGLHALADQGIAELEKREVDAKEADKSQFLEVDTDGKGHFTYDEFLAYAGYDDDDDLRVYFAKFDKNSDGVITIDEMRH